MNFASFSQKTPQELPKSPPKPIERPKFFPSPPEIVPVAKIPPIAKPVEKVVVAPVEDKPAPKVVTNQSKPVVNGKTATKTVQPQTKVPEALKHTNEVKKAKPSTLAEKLKLSLARSPPPPAPSKKISPAKVPSKPRIVVKEVTTPTKQANTGKTNSVMITKLWQGLKKDDIVDYFSKYGKIISVSMTESGNEMADGYKYLFLKFADVNSVEKLLGKW
jgi:hypothetical protein